MRVHISARTVSQGPLRIATGLDSRKSKSFCLALLDFDAELKFSSHDPSPAPVPQETQNFHSAALPGISQKSRTRREVGRC